MKHSTKAVVAAIAGGALLLGGAGSLAYWTDTEGVGGGDINGGTLSIGTDVLNTGCGSWVLDAAESATDYLAGDKLVPGDVLTKVCNFTIHAVGNHVRGTVDISTPSFSGADGDLDGMLDAAVSSLTVGGSPATEFTQADDGETLSVNVSVTWNSADTGHADATSVLDDLTLTAQQVHN